MPDIRERLHDAAPAARGYDEGGVRARVARRRRTRRVAGGALLALVLVAGAGTVIALDGGDDAEPVVADRPTSVHQAKVAGVTAVAFFGDEVWTGDETGWIRKPDGSGTGIGQGAVRRLETGANMLWVAGDTWVAAIGSSGGVYGVWDAGDTVADIQPLDDRRVAVSLPDAGEIAVVRIAGSEVQEYPRISVGARPTNLVLTTGNELWVNDGDVICRIDWNTRTANDEQQWSGALLAPSMSGGIWAVDGDRVVDLAPENLSVGVSVSEGDRYTVTATDVFETSFGLFVAGPDGLTRHEPGGAAPEVVDPEVPSDLAGSGDRVAYVVGGQVRTATPHSAANGGTQTTVPKSASDAAASFAMVTLGWDTVDVGDAVPQDESRIVTVTRVDTDRRAQVMVRPVGAEWVAQALWTFDDADVPASVSLGNGEDRVAVPYREDGLTPELTVRYGDTETVLTVDPGGDAVWEGDLGFVPDTTGWVQVLWRDADGVALEAWGTELPAGPFAAG